MTDPEKLINLDLEDRLTPEQLTELKERLKKDPEFARLYVRFGFLHSCIRNEFVEADLRQSMVSFASLQAGQETLEDPPPDGAKVREIEAYAKRQLKIFLDEEERQHEALQQAKRQKRWSILRIREAGQVFLGRAESLVKTSTRVTVYAAAVLVFVLAVSVVVQSILSQRVVATVTSTSQARWDTALIDGNDLRPGYLRLGCGYAKLTFKRGAEVLLQAPCEVELVNENRMRVLAGAMTATVPESAKGFAVETESAYVVDYGTEFGVAVNGAQDAEIHVFKGEVGVRSPQKSRRSKLQFLQQGLAAQTDLPERWPWEVSTNGPVCLHVRCPILLL